MEGLSEEETFVVRAVRDFVDTAVKPVAHELEQGNTYPERLIDTMGQMGVFGLAVPEPWGHARV